MLHPRETLRRRGFTLMEAVVAIFLLVAGFAIVAQLFHHAMQYSTRITTRQQAVAIANRRLEDIRAWSRAHHSPIGPLAMNQWGPFAVSPVSDPFDPLFEITTEFAQPEYFSPCTRFEQVVPGAERVTFTSHRCQVTVTVRWSGRESVRLTTYICAPTGGLSLDARPLRPWLAMLALWVAAAPPSPAGTSPLDPLPDPPAVAATYSLNILPVAPTPAGAVTLSHNEKVSYDARLEATVSGTPVIIPCQVRWASLGPGSGTMRALRGGNKVEFTHRLVINGLVVYADGLQNQLEAVAVYRGRVLRGRPPLLTLAP